MLWRIFEFLDEQVTIQLTELGVPVPFHKLGEEHMIREGQEFPMIVWVPIGGPITVARQLAADKQLDPTADGSPRIRQIGTRQETIHVHLWHQTLKDTETLLGHYVAMIRPLLTAFSFRVTGTAWSVTTRPPGNDTGTDVATGTKCVLAMELDIPLTLEPSWISAPPHHPTITPVIPATA